MAFDKTKLKKYSPVMNPVEQVITNTYNTQVIIEAANDGELKGDQGIQGPQGDKGDVGEVSQDQLDATLENYETTTQHNTDIGNISAAISSTKEYIDNNISALNTALDGKVDNDGLTNALKDLETIADHQKDVDALNTRIDNIDVGNTDLSSFEKVAAHQKDIDAINTNLIDKEDVDSHKNDIDVLTANLTNKEDVTTHNNDMNNIKTTVQAMETKIEHQNDITTINNNLATKESTTTHNADIDRIYDNLSTSQGTAANSALRAMAFQSDGKFSIASSSRILTNVANPIDNLDAANKQYVDSKTGGGVLLNTRTFTIMGAAGWFNINVKTQKIVFYIKALSSVGGLTNHHMGDDSRSYVIYRSASNPKNLYYYMHSINYNGAEYGNLYIEFSNNRWEIYAERQSGNSQGVEVTVEEYS